MRQVRRHRAGLLTLAVALAITVGAGIAWAAWTDTTGLRGSATAAFVPPKLLRVPWISGTAVDGEVLTAVDGLWSGLSPSATRTRQWVRCSLTLTNCGDIGGATGPTYAVPTGAVDAYRYAVRETVSNGGNVEAATSLPTLPQSPGSALSALGITLFRFATVTTTMPVISGTAAPTQTLTATPGTWSPRSLVGSLLDLVASSTTYQWLRCGPVGNEDVPPAITEQGCKAIPGRTASTYTVQDADIGHRIRVRVAHSSSITVVIVFPILVSFTGTVDTQATDVVAAP